MMRKILSLILCLLLIVSLSASAFAATITISGGANGAEYTAYKLMDVTHNADENIYNYTINETYEAVLKTVTGKDTEIGILDYLLQADDTAVRAFADALYTEIKDKTFNEGDMYTSSNNGFSSVDPGYYLVVETKDANDTDTVSLAMLKTVIEGSGQITTKEDYPTVEKFVWEINDSEANNGSWGESASYDIGDTIQFKLEGTVSDLYASYTDYYYSFRDTLEKTMTFTNPSDIVVKIDDEEDVTDKFHVSFGTDKNGNSTFAASANLKDIEGVSANSVIVLTYSAVLGENAIIGEPGNINHVYLVYQNDPYAESKGYHPQDPDKPDEPRKPIEPDEHGETPIDTVVVFTFKTIVNKTDPTGKALTGAGFTLYKWENVNNVWGWNAVAEEIKINEIGIDNKAAFNFNGLDIGIYKLVESTVPAGYNKADDILFAIVDAKEGLTIYDVTMDNNQPVKSGTTSNKFTVDNGIFTTNVVNNFGQELPATGGTGTTILYIVGSILVLAAIVLLVTKKRMANAE